MTNLLHIDSSLFPTTSASREVAATFRRTWEEEHPGGTVTYRDVAADPVPSLTAALVTARATDPGRHTPDQARAAAISDALVSEVEAADAYLFSVPMYNWGVHTGFKSWLDHIIVGGRTISAEGELPLAGRPATAVTSRGGSYRPGTPKEGWDFVDPYLEKVLAGALGLDLRIIPVELTLAHTTPSMAPLRDLADESRARANVEAANHARQVAALFKGARA